MITDLKKYRENSRKEGLCEEYSKIWDSCRSSKDLMDMALGSKGVDFLCDSIAKGWGIDLSYFCERFSNFINGKYERDIDGYTSKLYCRYEGHLEADSTILTLLECNCTVNVKDFAICTIYCSGKCHIKLSGKGQVVFVCYGNEEDVVIEGNCGNMKRINKKKRDTYE